LEIAKIDINIGFKVHAGFEFGDLALKGLCSGSGAGGISGEYTKPFHPLLLQAKPQTQKLRFPGCGNRKDGV